MPTFDNFCIFCLHQKNDMVTKECMADCLRICPLYQKMEFTTDDGEMFHLLDEGDTFSLFYNDVKVALLFFLFQFLEEYHG